MSPDFIVVLSAMLPDGTNGQFQYVLSDFNSDSDRSSYRVMKDEILSSSSQFSHINWVSVNLVMGNQLITYMQGSLEWFRGVEYFKKLIGDMGGSFGVEPSSYGFIDQQHGIRVEFENGVVGMSSI